MKLLDKIIQLNNNTLHIEKGSKILVGLSGGADSTALVCALKELEEKLDITLCAVHVNHMIRQGEADRDQQFSEQLCKSKGIPFYCKKIDIPALCEKSGNSTELEARIRRYEAFEQLAKQVGADYIATAHNKNDLCETMIFNLVRGCSLKGLTSVPAKRDNIIRPLLNCSREEIENYLKQSGQDFVTDSTNFDTIYSRNHIRHKVMPALLKINPSLNDTLFKSSLRFKQDNDFLYDLARQHLNNNTAALCELAYPVCSRVVCLLYQNTFGQNAGELGSVHIEKIVSLIYEHGKQKGYRACVCLSQKKYAVIDSGKLIFCNKFDNTANSTHEFNISLKKGENIIEGTDFLIFVSRDGQKPKTDLRIYNLLNIIELSDDIIKGNLFVRSRKNADSYKTCGMTKSLKKLFNDKKIPLAKRNLIPILCDDEGIIYVPCFTVADRFSNKNKQESLTQKTVIYFYETKKELE